MVPNHFIFPYQMRYINNKTLISLISPVPECVYAYHMSIMVQKSSPFIEKFNFILQRAVEIGIISHQYAMSKWDISMEYVRQAKRGHIVDHEIHLIGLKEMETLFIYYSAAMAVSIGVFFIELYVGRRRNKQNQQQQGRCQLGSNHRPRQRIIIIRE